MTIPQKRVHSLGVSFAGGNPLDGRKKSDFYATPPLAIKALLPFIPRDMLVWECCCGDGALAKVMEDAGLKVVGSDLFDRGYGECHGDDYDIRNIQSLLSPCIVTNPPFSLASTLIEKILPLQPVFFALLLKATFWHATTRVKLYNRYKPSEIYPLGWRLDFEGKKKPVMEFSWFVWRKIPLSNAQIYQPLVKPE